MDKIKFDISENRDLEIQVHNFRNIDKYHAKNLFLSIGLRL